MREPTPKTIHLKDYTPPAFLVTHVELDVDIREDHALVRAKLHVQRNRQGRAPLVLDGDELELVSVALDGQPAAHRRHARQATDDPGVPDAFTLETVTRIVPQKNTKLEGLYASKDGFFTQCEAEGFRRITWFARPAGRDGALHDHVHADTATVPGAAVQRQPVAARRRAGRPALGEMGRPVPQARPTSSRWSPRTSTCSRTPSSPAPAARRSSRSTSSRASSTSAAGDGCLKRAMKWDEERFGLELDLDQYKIVAVGDFNLGAMENKGLNIFNTKYVARHARTPRPTPTYLDIDRVVAHEYFHNWTGNRVTCRDWFQLSLKEGLTVFRDQEYGADTYSRAVHAHPGRAQAARGAVPRGRRPDGAPGAPAVLHRDQQLLHRHGVREGRRSGAHASHTLLGAEQLPARHGPVLRAPRRPGGDLRRLRAGDGRTPSASTSRSSSAGTTRPARRVLEVTGDYDAAAKRYTLTRASSRRRRRRASRRSSRCTSRFAVGLIGPDGSELPLRLEGEAGDRAERRVLSVTQAEQRFVFTNVPAKPVPSLLRGFSAPVILQLRLHRRRADAPHGARRRRVQPLGSRPAARDRASCCAGSRRPRRKRSTVPRAFVEAFARVLAGRPGPGVRRRGAGAARPRRYLAEQMDGRRSGRASTRCANACGASSAQRCATSSSGPIGR